MEKLKRSKFTRAGKIANKRLVEAVLDPDSYPGGTTFIAADQEDFDSILAEAVAEHRPVAVFFPDGHEIVTA
jgi:LmbE family N-acetylglucosaminyl deacetylase